MTSRSSQDQPIPPGEPQRAVFGCAILLEVVSCVCVVGRIYTRLNIIHSASWDDLLVALCFIMATVSIISECLLIFHGVGLSWTELNPTEQVRFIQFYWLHQASFATSCALIKVALLLQYRRMYDTHRKMAKLCCIGIIVIATWGVVFSFMNWFPNFPPSDYWNIYDPQHHTGYGFGSPDPKVFMACYEALLVTNTCFDIFVLLLAAPLASFKNGSLQHRLRFFALFSLGTIVVGTSMGRLGYVVHIGDGWILDTSRNFTTLMLLADIEISASVACASIPVFWPTLSSKIERVFITKEINVTTESRLDEEIALATKASGDDRLSGPPQDHPWDTYVLRNADPLSIGRNQQTTVEVG